MRVRSKTRPTLRWGNRYIIDVCYLGSDTWFLVLAPELLGEAS